MPERFAVMGNPIAHSLSPFIHQQFAQQTAIELDYQKIRVEVSYFEEQVSAFFRQGGKGLNITLPFKERAFVMANNSSARCQQAKAANTLWLSEEGLAADNTDGIGLLRDLARYLHLAGKQVLILGAGGAARGLINPLLAAGARLSLANRTKEKALALEAEFPALTCMGLDELQGSYDLILNATSAGLLESPFSLPAEFMENSPFCYDLAYSFTGQTAFINAARKAGCLAVDGLGMLVEQAAESFFIWHGIKPDSEAVLSDLRAQQNHTTP